MSVTSVAVIVLTVMTVVNSQELKYGQILSCLMEVPNNETENLEELITLPENNRSVIFFIKTSCDSELYNKVTLNPRQICAAESAAKLNPDADIYILFPAITQLDLNENLKTLLEYPNVYFRYVNVRNIVKGSPMEKDNIFFSVVTSKWAVWHMSDILRLLVLYKFGGTYLDFDIIVKKSLKSLGTNYAGRDANVFVANGVINVDKTGFGHSVVGETLSLLTDLYDPKHYNNNGGGVFTAALEHKCNVRGIDQLMTDCNQFKIYPKAVFYPLDFDKWLHYFEEDKLPGAILKIQHSYMIHVWNSRSRRFRLRKDALTLYTDCAMKYCPKLYKSINVYF